VGGVAPPLVVSVAEAAEAMELMNNLLTPLAQPLPHLARSFLAAVR
jgi:hypothetical protein